VISQTSDTIFESRSSGVNLPLDKNEFAPPNPCQTGWYSIYTYLGGLEG